MSERRVCGGLPAKNRGRSVPGFCERAPMHEGEHIDQHGLTFSVAAPGTADTRKLGARKKR